MNPDHVTTYGAAGLGGGLLLLLGQRLLGLLWPQKPAPAPTPPPAAGGLLAPLVPVLLPILLPLLQQAVAELAKQLPALLARLLRPPAAPQTFQAGPDPYPAADPAPGDVHTFPLHATVRLHRPA